MKKDQPKTIGAFLEAAQVDEIARTIYNRFQYEYGLHPQWLDDINQPTRKMMCKRVKEVLDALAINGFVITHSEEKKNVGREYLTKATPFGGNSLSVPKKRRGRKAKGSEFPAAGEGQEQDGSGDGNVRGVVSLLRAETDNRPSPDGPSPEPDRS